MNINIDYHFRCGYSWHFSFMLSFFSFLQFRLQQVNNTTNSLEQGLEKGKLDRDVSVYKLCCVYKERVGRWPLTASLMGYGVSQQVPQCQPPRKMEQFPYCTSLCLFFTLLKTRCKGDSAKNVDVEGIRDSLGMAQNSHLFFSSGAKSPH